VIHDILLVGRSGPSKTQIIFRANLSFPLAERYISYLLAKGHLQICLDRIGVQRYRLTNKGERLLGFLGEIEKELEGLFPEGLVSKTSLLLRDSLYGQKQDTVSPLMSGVESEN